MHWIKLDGQWINLSTVSNVVECGPDDVMGYDNNLRVDFAGTEQLYTRVTNPQEVISVRARLDALAEIATHRTAANLPALAEETE